MIRRTILIIIFCAEILFFLGNDICRTDYLFRRVKIDNSFNVTKKFITRISDEFDVPRCLNWIKDGLFKNRQLSISNEVLSAGVVIRVCLDVSEYQDLDLPTIIEKLYGIKLTGGDLSLIEEVAEKFIARFYHKFLQMKLVFSQRKVFDTFILTEGKIDSILIGEERISLTAIKVKKEEHLFIFEDDGALVLSSGNETYPELMFKLVDGHFADITAIAVLGDGRIVSSDAKGGFEIWDLDKRRVFSIITGAEYPPIAGMTVLSDGRLATIDKEGGIAIWDMEKRSVTTFEGIAHKGGFITQISDGRVVAGGYDSRIVVLDLKEGSCQAATLYNETGVVIGRRSIDAIGQKIVLADMLRSCLLIVDFDNKTVKYIYDSSGVKSAAFLSPDTVISVGNPGRLSIWDLNKDKVTSLWKKDCQIYNILPLSDNCYVTGSFGGQLNIWDMINGETINLPHQYSGSEEEIKRVPILALYPGGYIVSAEGRTINVWNIGFKGN